MKRVFFIAFFSLLSVIILSAFLGFISIYDPPRHGRVIDADTKEPIEGVVVMGYWRINYFPEMFIGAPSYYYDAREVVTDEEGYFTLPGLGLWLYPGYLNGPYTSVYKKEYKNRSWGKDRRVIPLRKLDEEESIYRISLNVPSSDWYKIKRYLQEIDHHSLK